MPAELYYPETTVAPWPNIIAEGEGSTGYKVSQGVFDGMVLSGRHIFNGALNASEFGSFMALVLLVAVFRMAWRKFQAGSIEPPADTVWVSDEVLAPSKEPAAPPAVPPQISGFGGLKFNGRRWR